MKWNATGKISKPRGWYISKLLILLLGIHKNISFNGKNDNGGTLALFEKVIKSTNHQAKMGDLDKRLNAFYCLYTDTSTKSVFFFCIQCVPHNSTYRVFTHTIFYKIVSQSSTWEQYTEPSSWYNMNKEMSPGTVRSWAENHTNPHFCGNLNFYV